MVENVDDWSFDVFHVNEVGDGHALKYVGYELLQKYNLINKFKVCVQLSSTRSESDGLCGFRSTYSYSTPGPVSVWMGDCFRTVNYLSAEPGTA